MEDRMLSDEVLLALIKKNGGGGTSDYSRLTNKPEINGVTLSGDKSASDLSLASLDANGKVPASQLPSYVDDVINGYLHDGKFYEDDQYTTEIAGEDGKIYVDLATNKTYRWSGLAFVEISESLALGETASTAYAGDKGKANADAITAIKDGQSIDSFGDVETALAGKQATLSAGSHIDIDSNTVSVNRWAVPAGDVLYTVITGSGDYGREIHVQRHTVGGTLIDDREYHIDTWGSVDVDNKIRLAQGYAQWNISLLADSKEHSSGYSYNVNPNTTETSNSFTFTLTQEENDNDLIIREELDDVDIKITAIKDGTTIDSFADVETALSGKQATLTFDNVPTDGSNNPVKSDGIYDALAGKQAVPTEISYADWQLLTPQQQETGSWLVQGVPSANLSTRVTALENNKQNASGNSTLTTTDKTIVGAINEVNSNKQNASGNTSLTTTDKTIVGAINEVSSNLSGYEATTNAALDLPNGTGKNLIPLSVATMKAINTSGSWDGDAYTFNGVTFTVQKDSDGNITGIKATGTATGASYILLVSASATNPFTTKMLGRTVILNGCPAGGSENTYKINIYYYGQTNVIDTGSGATKTYPTTGNNNNIALNVSNGYEIPTGGIMFYPMLRMADITDATFTPYVSSVETRLEAVESCKISFFNPTGTKSTDENGSFSVDIPNVNGKRVYAIDNLSSDLSAEYRVIVANVYTASVACKLRKYSDNTAVANTTVDMTNVTFIICG